MDLFEAIHPDENLHPQFLQLRDSPRFGPARAMLRDLQGSMADPDGNFVEQFQTSGFDARTLELCLFSFFQAEGHEVDRSHNSPDFLITKDGLTVAVEAVTASQPSNDGVKPYLPIPDEKDPDAAAAYLKQDLPVRLGSPLYSKLQKKYWELPQCADKPLVLAIQDFHAAGSLIISSTPLSHYLFGSEQHWYHDDDGQLIISEHKLEKHKGKTKEIPSGFFNLPGAENISAVLFCNSATVPKFNRLGHQGKYHSDAVRMIRWGTRYKHDPNAVRPALYMYEVGDQENYLETWSEGTALIHNPNAVLPLPDEWLGAGSEEKMVDNRVVVTWKEYMLPYSSMTQIFPGSTPDLIVDSFMSGLESVFLPLFPPE
jgi:hypothetical protein